MQLTKTQIGYFQERVRLMARRVKKTVEKCYPIPKTMTKTEKLELIASGQAVLKYDELAEKIGDRWNDPYLFNAYEFPGECQKERAASEAADQLKALLKEIDVYAEKLCDDFVLGRVDDPTALLNDFEASAPRFIAGTMPQ